MRNLENIDLDTLDHVTGGCGSSKPTEVAPATTEPNPPHMASYDITGAGDTSYRPRAAMVNYLPMFSGGSPEVADDTPQAVQAETTTDSDDGYGHFPAMHAADVAPDHQAGHGRFGGFHEEVMAAVDAEVESTAAQTAPSGDQGAAGFGHFAAGHGHGHAQVAQADDDGTSGTGPVMVDASAWLQAQDVGQTASTADSGPGSMVCGVTDPGGDAATTAGDGTVSALGFGMEHGSLDGRVSLGSFHQVGHEPTAGMAYGGDLEAAPVTSSTGSTSEGTGFALSTDLGEHGHLSIENGDVNADLNTPYGAVHLGYNAGQFGVSFGDRS